MLEYKEKQETITLMQNDLVMVVCFNGRTRSKYTARALNELLGLQNVRVAGLHDPHTRNRIRDLDQYKLIIAAGERDVVTALRNDSRYNQATPILHVPISEKEHAQLHIWHELGRIQQIKELLKPKILSLPIAIQPENSSN